MVKKCDSKVSKLKNALQKIILIVQIIDMNFQEQDYLNYREIKILIESKFTHEKANMIHDKLKIYYEKMNKKIKNKKLMIINLVSLLIQQSFKQLDDTEQENINLKYNQSYKKIFTNANIETYYPQLLFNLKK